MKDYNDIQMGSVPMVAVPVWTNKCKISSQGSLLVNDTGIDLVAEPLIIKVRCQDFCIQRREYWMLHPICSALNVERWSKSRDRHALEADKLYIHQGGSWFPDELYRTFTECSAYKEELVVHLDNT